VQADGRIQANGRGLVFAGGDTVGTALVVTPTGGTATLTVFATLICENVAPFIERNTNPVPLSAEGDFRINDVLTPPPPASCHTPVLLIRNAGNRAWFAPAFRSSTTRTSSTRFPMTAATVIPASRRGVRQSLRGAR